MRNSKPHLEISAGKLRFLKEVLEMKDNQLNEKHSRKKIINLPKTKKKTEKRKFCYEDTLERLYTFIRQNEEAKKEADSK